MCGLDNGIQNFRGDGVTLITAAAAMSLQQADGFVHEVSLILQALA
jgi:hypothetical protein